MNAITSDLNRYMTLVVIGLGIVLILVGLTYGVIFAGIPGPDDTPSQARSISVHGTISFATACIGALLFLIGIATYVIQLVSRIISKGRPQA